MLTEKQNKIVLENQKLITYAIKQCHLQKQYDEFYDIAMIGLVKGAKNYNENLEIALSTYLIKVIKNEILQELRKKTSEKRKTDINVVSINKEISSDKQGNSLTLSDISSFSLFNFSL